MPTHLFLSTHAVFIAAALGCFSTVVSSDLTESARSAMAVRGNGWPSRRSYVYALYFCAWEPGDRVDELAA